MFYLAGNRRNQQPSLFDPCDATPAATISDMSQWAKNFYAGAMHTMMLPAWYSEQPGHLIQLSASLINPSGAVSDTITIQPRKPSGQKGAEATSMLPTWPCFSPEWLRQLSPSDMDMSYTQGSGTSAPTPVLSRETEQRPNTAKRTAQFVTLITRVTKDSLWLPEKTFQLGNPDNRKSPWSLAVAATVETDPDIRITKNTPNDVLSRIGTDLTVIYEMGRLSFDSMLLGRTETIRALHVTNSSLSKAACSVLVDADLAQALARLQRVRQAIIRYNHECLRRGGDNPPLITPPRR